MTEPEVMLWSRLRRRWPDAPTFRRQHAMGPYILDFYCATAGLAIEIDGNGHGEDLQIAHDERRDAWLKSQGVAVYRVPASSVFADVDDVADGVRRLADERIAAKRLGAAVAPSTTRSSAGGPPPPSSSGRGRQG